MIDLHSRRISRRPKILFIDDDLGALRALERIGTSEGWEVVTAPSAREAVALVDDYAVDVVATDEWLPGLAGVDLLAQLRIARPNVVRVLMTRSSSPRELVARAVVEAGVHAVVPKPWRLPVLVATIRAAAAHARTLRIAAPADPAAAARVFRR